MTLPFPFFILNMTEHCVFLKSHDPKNELLIHPISTKFVILPPDTKEFKAKLKWRRHEFAHLCVKMCDHVLKVDNHHERLVASVINVPLNALNNLAIQTQLSQPLDNGFEYPVVLIFEKRDEWKVPFHFDV